MRVHGGIASVKLLATLVVGLQGSALWAQTATSPNFPSVPNHQLAPIVSSGASGKNAQPAFKAGAVVPVAHNEPVSVPSVGIPLQPLIPVSKQSQTELTLSPLLPNGDDNLPTVPPEAWGPGVALQPISRTSDAAAMLPHEHVASLPIAVLPMTKYDKAGSSATEAKAKLTTSMMTGPMHDPLSTFAKLDIKPAALGQPASPVRNHQDYIPWTTSTYTWFSPVFSHRPLYFEQPNLERYGMGSHYYLQPAYSSAHFFTSVALMPYKVLTQHPNEHVYTLGYGRPGNCEPFQGRTLIGQSYFGEACKVYDPYSGY